MSADINLLPWREEQRRFRDIQMMVLAIIVWVACVVLVGMSVYYIQSKQENQKTRNNYLKTENSKLDEQLKEVKELKSKKDNMVARMEVIQNLQRKRNQIVHLFDDIVRKLPEGVYFQVLTKHANQIAIEGTAQSNARVSQLMNDLDSSEWFTKPDLNVITVKASESVRLSQFQLNVFETGPNEGMEDEEDEELANKTRRGS